MLRAPGSAWTPKLFTARVVRWHYKGDMMQLPIEHFACAICLGWVCSLTSKKKTRPLEFKGALINVLALTSQALLSVRTS